MLPHDELYHSGVKGMRWGIRKKVAKAFERKAATRQGQADRARGEQKSAVKITGKAFDAKISSRERSAARARQEGNAKFKIGTKKMFERKAANREASAERARKDKALATKLASKSFEPKIQRRQRSADEAKAMAKKIEAKPMTSERNQKGLSNWKRYVANGAVGLAVSNVSSAVIYKATGFPVSGLPGLILGVSAGAATNKYIKKNYGTSS